MLKADGYTSPRLNSINPVKFVWKNLSKKQKATLVSLLFVVVMLPVTVLSIRYSKENRSRAAENIPLFVKKTDKIAVELGEEQTVFNSNIFRFPGNKYFTYRTKDDLYGVSGGWGKTYYTTTPLANTINKFEILPGMEKGTALFDRGIAFLMGIYKDKLGDVHGFYHAEDGTAQHDQTKTIAYAISKDGGKSFVKEGYPNNQIITGYQGGPAGDLSLVLKDDYIYMFYGDSRGLALARSRMADMGKPGTWKKYYCDASGECDFTEPGLGGNYTKILGRTRNVFVSYNTYLEKYISIDTSIRSNTVSFSVSDDFINWFPLTEEVISLPPPPPDKQNNNPSIISLEGDSAVSGKDFWLYYTINTDFAVSGKSEKMLRRKMSLSKKESPKPTSGAVISTVIVDEFEKDNIGKNNFWQKFETSDSQGNVVTPGEANINGKGGKGLLRLTTGNVPGTGTGQSGVYTSISYTGDFNITTDISNFLEGNQPRSINLELIGANQLYRLTWSKNPLNPPGSQDLVSMYGQYNDKHYQSDNIYFPDGICCLVLRIERIGSIIRGFASERQIFELTNTPTDTMTSTVITFFTNQTSPGDAPINAYFERFRADINQIKTK